MTTLITPEESREFQEATTVTFEWTVRNLKVLFDSSKGEAKSKVTKSVKFGGGRWQILLYPNSGHDGGYVSLYLSCEPTQEERENSVNGKWVREGLFKFSFDLKSTSKTAPLTFNSKEACDHAFSWKTMNWGWAQFAKRDAVYYSAPQVRSADAFLIVCTITSSPVPPVPPSNTPRQYVPRSLMESVGSLLNDPIYSDVEFVLPSRSGRRGIRRIYAAKKIISRAEYFNTMFSSGFSEASESRLAMARRHSSHDEDMMTIEDSDESDAEEDTDTMTTPPASALLDTRKNVSTENHWETESDIGVMVQPNGRNEDEDSGGTQDIVEERDVAEEASSAQVERSIDRKSANTSPSGGSSGKETSSSGVLVSPTEPNQFMSRSRQESISNTIPGPPKTTVVVSDVAYATYMAFLYYLYTDTIVFAPLSSTFLANNPNAMTPTVSVPVTPSINPLTGSYFSSALSSGMPAASLTAPPLLRTRSTMGSSVGGTNGGGTGGGNTQPNEDGAPKTRKDWINDWVANNPGRPAPVSAKAIYRLADKLDLRDLKERAFQHIIKSLTISNIPYETFSSFSASFEEVRKVEIQYFLNNWAEIRGGDAMRNVFQQIRMGRHPGFEEIWPLIVINLDFRPRSVTEGQDTTKDGRSAGTEA
ncbi:hypothetical protein FRC03_010314 [Tulasnella sp. 419]|nr:hypothetical protein FRC03_010314 [Tulasnella sp. 419]